MKAIIFDWTGTLYERHKGIFPFTKEVLESLKPKYKLGLVSKAGEYVPERNADIEKSGIKDYFDFIIVDSEKGTKQFKECIKGLGATPEETAVVGDRATREIQAGNKLGCTTIWIQKGDRSFDSPTEETGKADFIIDSIKEVSKVLSDLK